MVNNDALEFDFIRQILMDMTQIQINKERFKNLEMSVEKEEIENMLTQVDEFSKILFRFGKVEFFDLGNISESVNRACKGSTLTIIELTNILSMLKLILELEKYQANLSKEEFKCYYKIASNLTFLDLLYRELIKCIGNDFTILDTASIKLKKIRGEIKNCKNDIINKLNKIITLNSKILADTNIIYRNDRPLINVIASYKHSIKGVIVDESKSGASVYLEPEEISALTLKINLLKDEENEEIERILVYLSQYVASYKEEIITNFETILQLDFIFTKAKYGNSINGKRATLTNSIKLIGAKHPLLDKDKVIANNFILSSDSQKIMVISGPNTGGKSVALKTLGILIYMNQCGLLIPVNGIANLEVVDNIYLDLGDNQSIASSLSTFSSHILNISNILKTATSRSLVLLDEVGAGTDPKQGEALALSLIEEFHELNCYLLLTTHYDNLKNYALENDYIKICAMEFDNKTLKPTYKLLENSIGKSYGFEIAKLYGISDKIIERAIAYKEMYSNLNEKMLEKLQVETDKYRNLIKENEKLQADLNLEIENEKIKNDNLESLIKNIKESAKEEKERLLEESSKQIAIILESVKNRDNLKMHEVLKAKKELEELYEEQEEKKSLSVFNVGDYVFVSSLSQGGTIVKKNKDIYSVDLGKMTVKVRNTDLVKKEKENIKTNNSLNSKVKITSMSNELNLIGKTSSEALFELERFLDNARLINLTPLRIIHGFGKGVLRETVSNYLKKCSFVESFELAGYGQGSGGATIVNLKKRNEKV